MTHGPLSRTPQSQPQSPICIGVSACFFHADPARAVFKGKTLLYAEESMLTYIMNAGAMPILMPRPTDTMSVRVMMSFIDGLVLHGGADVAPESYGESPVRPEWSGDRERDVYELSLLTEAMVADRPVLGICRGHQVINVGLGGTLYQDLELMHPEQRVHRDWPLYDRHEHDLSIAPETWLERVFPGRGRLARVNSVHHQGIKDLGRDLVVEARSLPDGVIEAIRYQRQKGAGRSPFVYGVQWHPEFTSATGHEGGLLPAAPLLAAWLDEVRVRKADRGEA